MRIEKLSKKLGLNVDQIKNIVYYHHALNNLLTKKEMKNLDLNIELNSMKYIRKVAKVLKVTDDAVINAVLQNYLKLKKQEK